MSSAPQPYATAEALFEVARERERQFARWGEQNHPDGTGPNLRSPFADTLQLVENSTISARMQARCSSEHRIGFGTWEHILTEEYAEALAESDPARLRAELIQVAAVAVAWVEAIDRRADS